MPLSRHPGVYCFWRLVVRWPGKPFSGAEHSPVAFICKLEKQVCIGPIVGGEGQSAISNRASAHEISNPQRQRIQDKDKDLVPDGAGCGAIRFPEPPAFPRAHRSDPAPAGFLESWRGYR
jgi:hypothetical protein